MSYSMETMMNETKIDRKIGDIDPISFAGAVAQAAAVRFQLAKLDDDTAMEDGALRLELNGWMTAVDDHPECLEAEGARVAETLDSMAIYVCDRVERSALVNGEILFNKCYELDLVSPGQALVIPWEKVPLEFQSLFNLYTIICAEAYRAMMAEQRAEAQLERYAAQVDAAPKKVPADQLIFERDGSSLEKDPDMVVKQPAAGKAKVGRVNGTPVKTMSAGETVAKVPTNKGGRPRKGAVRKPAAKSTTGAAQKS